MGMLKFEVPHGLSKDEALARAKKLLEYWGTKYGIASSWSGDTAKMNGKVMGITLEAEMTITQEKVSGEATDPGMLLRGKARRYLEEKFQWALDPSRKAEDLTREA
ncbi:MAG: polyhydroxyalkanoic acid system family protein [Myxococcaceae bacterium]